MLKIVYEFLTNILTSPLGLPIDFMYEWFIMMILGAIAFLIAWNIVGSLGVRGQVASELHWAIRILAIVVLWATTRSLIQAYYYFSANWELGFTIIGGVVGAVVLPTIAVATMRTIKKLKVNGNA